MNISYSTGKLEKILTNPRLIKKEYTQIYLNVINRISELRAANNLEEIPHIPPPKRHKLYGDYDGCWGINVSKNYRIILKPAGEWIEEDLKTITSIEILSISDYH